MAIAQIDATTERRFGKPWKRANVKEAEESLLALHATRVALGISWWQLWKTLDTAGYQTVRNWRKGKRTPAPKYLSRMICLLLQLLATKEGKAPDTYLNGEILAELETITKKQRTRAGVYIPKVKGQASLEDILKAKAEGR